LGIADLDRDDPFALKRLDTNDLPVSAGEPPREWTGPAAQEEGKSP